MGAVDYIAIAAIVLTLSVAVFYIVHAKKRGDKCVGCPYAKECGGKCSSQFSSKSKSEENSR